MRRSFCPVGRAAALAAALAALGSSRPGHAQTPSPGNLIPQGSPIPRVSPPALPSTAPGLQTPGPATPTAGVSGAVAVRAVAFDGATAFARPQLEQVAGGLVGPSTPVSRIEAARVAILNTYRSAGYALTTVTATLDARGTLRFAVIEGRIAEVKLEGDIGPAATQVLRFLRHLTEVRPIDNATLERWLLLAQDVPGVTLHAVLQPSSAEPGALTLVAQLDKKTVSGLATADNRAYRLTGTQQLLATVEVDSLTSLGERTAVTAYHTSGNTQNFGQGSVEVFLGGSGLRLRAYGGYGEANPAEFLRSIGYHGTTAVFGAGLTYPLIRARQQTLNIAANFDAVESTISTTQNAAQSSMQTGRDALRILRVGADYALQDGLLGDDRPAVNSVSVRLSQGLPGIGASSNGEATATRLGEKVDFTKATFDLARVQTLFSVWTDATVAFKGRALGQVTGNVLPPAEKFFLGGADYNRGYYSGEVTGDNALVLSAELQLNATHELTLAGRTIPIGVQYYAFYDYGETWEKNTDRDAKLSSLGLGTRLTVTRFTEFGLEYAHRNTRYVGGSSATTSPLKADTVYWRVTTRF